jgi:hydroxyacyl-ACP dehydratase HTD2-like protein with hotdog domain
MNDENRIGVSHNSDVDLSMAIDVLFGFLASRSPLYLNTIVRIWAIGRIYFCKILRIQQINNRHATIAVKHKKTGHVYMRTAIM